jgi:hypothetical protein
MSSEQSVATYRFPRDDQTLFDPPVIPPRPTWSKPAR